MRRSVPNVSLGLVSVFTLASAGAAQASPPEVPTRAVPATTLRDFLRHSTLTPSTHTLEALAREGLAFDPDGPMLLPARRAAGDPMRVVGEVAVLEGDTDVVTDFGSGRYGLRYDNGRQDPMTIVERFIG